MSGFAGMNACSVDLGGQFLTMEDWKYVQVDECTREACACGAVDVQGHRRHVDTKKAWLPPLTLPLIPQVSCPPSFQSSCPW